MLTFFQAPFFLDSQWGTFPVGINGFFLLGVKGLYIIGAILYLVFAFVVIRQIQVMRNTVLTPFSSVVQALGIIHLLMALAILILFITVL